MTTWLDMVVGDYVAPVWKDDDCVICEAGGLCYFAAETVIRDVAECWEGPIDDVAAWAYINAINLADYSIPQLQKRFLAYREQVARAQRAQLEAIKLSPLHNLAPWFVN
jgi:hypothetical protein